MPCTPGSTARPLAKCAMVVAMLGACVPAPALAAPGTLHRHVAGFSFRYPAGWSVADKEGLLLLQPPGPRSAQGAATEMYVLGTESVAGLRVEQPDDPRIVGSVERQLQRLSPALRRVGEVHRLPIPRGRGVLANVAAVLDFAATGRAGQSVWSRAYVCIVGDTSVILFGFGLRENVSARDAALRGMMTSITATARPAAPPPSPGPAAAPVAGPAPAAGAVPAVDLGGDDWGLRARAPARWRARQQGEVALLGHDSIAGLIIVRPHQEKNAAAVRALMQRGLAEEGIRIAPAGALKPAGKGALAADYTGTAQGQPIRARIIGLTSPHGGGAWVFAVTTPPKFGRGLTDAADTLARGVRWLKPVTVTTPLMKHFAGTWNTSSTHSSRRVTLGADGRYYSSSESYYGGRFNNSQGDWTGSWGSGGQSRAAGRWRIQGDQRSGVLTIILNDGGTQQYRYQVHVEKGKTFWREYKFNGVHYAKQ